MSLPSLKIAGVEFSVQTFPAVQTYDQIEGATLHRFRDGAALKQQHWRKISTTLSGSGWMSPALAGVDWSQPVEIHCISPRTINSATASAVLPAARRSDFTGAVFCHAVVAGALISTPVVVSTNTATATAVAGATAYQFSYYPKLSFYSSGPQEELDIESATYAWQLTGEEA